MSCLKCCFDPNEMPDVIDTIIQKCSDPGCCCGCCSALRPRYKRLVDNIFPVDPQDGLVKANMDKLTFYSLSSPEKLDRIGEYLFQRASRDIYRRRYGFVIIAMEAMDRLLKASHAKTLNLFGESFLKMVQKLLESSEPKLQILATQSFVHFANIEEDTPSYHRRYDFFVSKFSSMCHSNNEDENIRDSLRLAGIQGLQGVVRKTVSDDLVENIWNKQHMDKIVPSLLFNMQNAPDNEADCNPPQIQDDPDPPTLAEACLRELVGRASFGHIHSVIKPVLRHLDNHQLWVPNTFAIKTFRIIMFSIQAQYSYTVVEALMNHLDQNSESNPQIRTSIADVLSKIIAIAAGESVGPSVLEIINSLLSNLRKSVSRTSDPNPVESQYQEALINALGEFANHLPDYQKIEIMMFIMNKVPYPCNDMLGSDTMLQNILLKSLLKVGTKYKSVHLDKTFQLSFLDPLLRMASASDPKMRVLVQNILHTLIDRHNNLNKLSVASIKIQSRDLILEQSSRPDLIFINKHGPAIYNSLYASLLLEETDVECINATYTTLSLLCVELASADTATDILQLILGIQQIALTSKTMALPQRYNLLAMTIALLNIIPQVLSIPALQEYTKKLIEARRAEAQYLLPPLLDVYEPGLVQSPTSLPHLMIDQLAICECLKAVGMDVSRLQQPSPYGNANANITMTHRHSWVEAGTSRGSITDLSSFNNDVDSVSSSPGVQRSKSVSFPYRESTISLHQNFLINWYEERSNQVHQKTSSLKTNLKYNAVRRSSQKSPGEGLNFESMKKALCEPQDSLKQMRDEQRKQIGRAFRQDSFNDLVKRTHPKHELLQNKLNDIFSSLDATKSIEQSRSDENSPQMKPAYEKHFPELFIH